MKVRAPIQVYTYADIALAVLHVRTNCHITEWQLAVVLCALSLHLNS